MKITNVMRTLAASTAILMTVTLAACTGTTAPTASPVNSSSPTVAAATSTPVASSTTEATASAPATVDKSPITLTVGMSPQNCTLGDGIHQEYSVLKEITNQTGVTLSFVTYDATKFKVLAAGGDLPDLISIDGTDTAVPSSLISSGALLQLDSLLDQYGQNIEQNIPIGLKWSKTVIGNGKTYLLPVCTTVADTSNPSLAAGAVFNTRYDIYKAIGSPKMSNEDDYLNVLKQMQDYQRKAASDNKIYALSAWSDWGLWPYSISYPFAYGYTNSGNFQINRVTGEIEGQYLKEDGIFWKALKFFNKAYQMGIFDPEGLTMKYAQYADKVTSGKVLAMAAQWLTPDPKVCGDKAILAVLPGAFPYIPEVYSTDSPIGYQLAGARAVNVNCKYPERAMQLLNYFESQDGARLLKDGVKGVDWDVVDGKAQIIGDRLSAIKSGTLADYEKQHPTGIAGDNHADLAMFWTSGSVKTNDGLPVDLTATAAFQVQTATVAQKAFAQDYDSSLSYPGQVYDKWIKAGIEKSLTTVPLASTIIAPISTTSQQIESKATDYFTSNLAKLIMAKDDATFNTVKASMVAAVKAMGLEAADAEYQKNYDAAKTVAESFK